MHSIKYKHIKFQVIKKLFVSAILCLISFFVSAQYVYNIKADNVKLTNDSCDIELIIENSTKNVCGFLFNKGNGRTEFRKILVPIGVGTNKYLVGCDTLDLSGVGVIAKDGLLKVGDSLYLGNTISGTGTHNFTTNRYQYLNGKFYSIGGTVNDPVTQPIFRFYNNGDFTAKAQNNLTGNPANANGIRYTSKYGLFEIGTSNNFDTTIATTCCGNSLKAALIINSDVANTFRGHVHGSVIATDQTLVDTAAVISWSGVFGEIHTIKGWVNKSLVVGYGQQINSSMYGSILGGYTNHVNSVFNYGTLNGAFNTVADTSNFATVNGIYNNFGGINQVVFGTGITNRSPFGIMMGNKSVDFSTMPYPGASISRFALETVNDLQNYPLFVIANSYANESNNSIKSNAITTLFNGRTQINTTGFNANLTQSDVTPKAALEVVSTNSGVLLPRLTGSQRNAIVSGDLHNGLLLYNTGLSKFQFYNGSSWISIADSLSSDTSLTFSTGLTRSGNVITNDVLTGKGNTQTFYGGTATGDSLRISSTTNATKGLVKIGAAIYNEATDAFYNTQATGGAFIARQMFGGSSTATGSTTVRLTNGGSSITPAIFGGSSSSTAGNLSLSYDVTNGLEFNHGNGSVKVVGAGITITNLVNTAGSESGDLIFLTQSGGTARSEKMRIASDGKTGIGVTATSTLQVGGSFALAYVAKTANYTVTSSDYTINVTSNSPTITLPTAVGITGRVYIVKNSGAGSVSVATTSSQTIDGSTTYTLGTQYKYVNVQSNGANWIITGNN